MGMWKFSTEILKKTKTKKKNPKTSKIEVGTDIIYSLIGDQGLHRALLSNWHCAISGQLKGSALAVQE